MPIRVAVSAAALTLALLAGAGLLLGLAHLMRNERSVGVRRILGRILAAALLSLVPLALLSIAGLTAAALADLAGTPAIAFPFVSVAGIAGLRVAWTSRRGGEMGGCNRMIGLWIGTYVTAWGSAAWWAAGGAGTLGADVSSLRWLQPPLAASPLALLAWRLAGRKRTAGLLLGFLLFLSAWLALWFFTVESGRAAALLPNSDWLRFPIAALGAALLLALLRLAKALQGRGPSRSRALRELPGQAMQCTAITLPMGFAWAAARTLVLAL